MTYSTCEQTNLGASDLSTINQFSGIFKNRWEQPRESSLTHSNIQNNHKVQSTISAQPAYEKEEIEATVDSGLPKLDFAVEENYLDGIKLV